MRQPFVSHLKHRLWQMREPLPGAPRAARAFKPIYLQKQRGDGWRFASARSWLGGAARVRIWPQTSLGRPMEHVATLNLEDLSEITRSALPREGYLVFFAGLTDLSLEARVMHVPALTDGRLPDHPLSTEGFAADHLRCRTAQDGAFLPRWPLRFSATPPKEPANAIHLNARSLSKILPRGAEPWLWDSVQRLVASMPRTTNDYRRAMVQLTTEAKRLEASCQHIFATEPPSQSEKDRLLGRVTAQLDRIETQYAAMQDPETYGTWVSGLRRWAGGQPSFDPLPDAEFARLQDIVGQLQAKGKWGALYRAGKGPRYHLAVKDGVIDAPELVDDTLVALCACSATHFETLAVPLRATLASYCESSGQHRMFGSMLSGAKDATVTGNRHRLLELSSDHVAGILGSGQGALVFTISDRALRERNWDDVQLKAGVSV